MKWGYAEYSAWLNNPSASDASKVLELKLSSARLKSLPDSIGEFVSLEKLDIAYNQLVSLPDSLGNLTKLTYLDVAMNQLTSLPDSIGNLKRLTVLMALTNQLTSLPNSIGNLRNLTHLDMRRNQLASLPDSIGNLHSLTVLNVAENRLTSLPDSIGNLHSLTELSIYNNNLTSLSLSLVNLSSLTTLYLSSNMLTSLPVSLFKHGMWLNLTDVDFSDNLLSSLPDMQNVPNLEILDVSHNQLTSLPDSLWNLTNLKRLSLYENQLTSLPESLGNLTKLEKLYVSDNRLTGLPESLGDLTRLKALNLSNNRIRRLPDSFYQLDNLVEFYVSGNNGIIIDMDQIEDMPGYGGGDFELPLEEYAEFNEPIPAALAFEVHRAFGNINLSDLYAFFESKFSVLPTMPDHATMIAKISQSMESFLSKIGDETERATIAAKFHSILDQRLTGLLYNLDQVKMIHYCLDYVKLQPDVFQAAYATFFVMDCAHAYNGPNGMTCAKGALERFPLSLVSAAIAVQSSNPELYKEEYTQLIHILENKTKTMKEILMEHGSKCFTDADGNEAQYRDCMKRMTKEELAAYPGNNAVNAFLTEHGTANMFGGVHRKSKVGKTRKVRKVLSKGIQSKVRKTQSKVRKTQSKVRKTRKGRKTRKSNGPVMRRAGK